MLMMKPQDGGGLCYVVNEEQSNMNYYKLMTLLKAKKICYTADLYNKKYEKNTDKLPQSSFYNHINKLVDSGNVKTGKDKHNRAWYKWVGAT